MLFHKNDIRTLGRQVSVPAGTGFTYINDLSGAKPQALALSKDSDVAEYIDVDYVITGNTMAANSVITLQLYRDNVLIKTLTKTLGAKTVGTYTERFNDEMIQKADKQVVEFKAKQNVAYTLTVFATSLSVMNTLELDGAVSIPTDCDFTIGVEAADVIKVSGQLKNVVGANIAVETPFIAYLTNDASGYVETAVTTLAEGTQGQIIKALTANANVLAVSNSSGAFDFDLTQAGAATRYLVIQLPGKRVISPVITFAA